MLRLFCVLTGALSLSGCLAYETFIPHNEFAAAKTVIEDCSRQLPDHYRRESYNETLINLGEPTKTETLRNGRVIIDYDRISASRLALCDKRKPHVFEHLHFEYDAEGRALDRKADARS
jgi:hypothetical protein